MNIELLLQHIVNGITLGSLYALIAIGYTMVYGILRFINFAHGDIFMLGAYVVFYAVTVFHVPWMLAALMSVFLVAVIGVLIERVAYRPLRDAPRISVLISAIGVSFFLENAGLVVFSGIPKSFPVPPYITDVIEVGGVRFLVLTVVVPFVSLLLMAGLLYIVYKTKPGLAMRAISFDIEATRIMGVKVDNIIAFTFGLGSFLAAAGGIMWALRYPQINPLMGIIPGLKAFIAAVFGGIGSIQGAMLGGFLLGMIEILAIGFFPEFSGYRDAIAFIILIVILLVKPTGLLGEKVEEKV